MSERPPFRAGDVVRDTAIGGREWIVDLDEAATVDLAVTSPSDDSRRLIFGSNTLSRFVMVTAASDEVRLARLRKVVADQPGFRASLAQAILDAEPKPRRTLADVVADPPDGWRVTMVDTYETTLSHNATHSQVSLHGPLNRAPWVSSVQAYVPQAFKYRARVAGHRAVAELLEALAEVSGE